MTVYLFAGDNEMSWNGMEAYQGQFKDHPAAVAFISRDYEYDWAQVVEVHPGGLRLINAAKWNRRERCMTWVVNLEINGNETLADTGGSTQPVGAGAAVPQPGGSADGRDAEVAAPAETNGTGTGDSGQDRAEAARLNGNGTASPAADCAPPVAFVPFYPTVPLLPARVPSSTAGMVERRESIVELAGEPI